MPDWKDATVIAFDSDGLEHLATELFKAALQSPHKAAIFHEAATHGYTPHQLLKIGFTYGVMESFVQLASDKVAVVEQKGRQEISEAQ